MGISQKLVAADTNNPISLEKRINFVFNDVRKGTCFFKAQLFLFAISKFW